MFMLQTTVGSRTNTFISNELREAVYRALLEKSSNGKLKKNSTHIVSEALGVNIRTVQRIWSDAKK